MTAAVIAAALGGARRERRDWRCRCPLHGGCSLSLRDGRNALLVKCWAGCDARDVLAELYLLRLLDIPGNVAGGSAVSPIERTDDELARRIEIARRMWSGAREARGSPVARYLASRSITSPPPPSLRWAPACPQPSGLYLPAMLARIDNIDGELIGVHRTFLKPDGSGKADAEPPKTMIGRAMGGAVRLGAVRPDHWLVIGEGIESTASAIQLWTSPSGWAALSASGLRNLILPPRGAEGADLRR
jgi:putative DNA primase/helicase